MVVDSDEWTNWIGEMGRTGEGHYGRAGHEDRRNPAERDQSVRDRELAHDLVVTRASSNNLRRIVTLSTPSITALRMSALIGSMPNRSIDVVTIAAMAMIA
ncbi:MAG: hypothetical protein GY734_06990 [Herbaspirillum sp.]|uniref:hypothetical protein n=1 Tax=Herbaspirillum sp. TaxID=1890675 RepID=UPI00258BCB77|nr:hypothetical protein [Herbaspirillum sp.]MCP3656687.1 hypothetical protein [Herbaspirillum sp.]MCP3950441.1 hypothetical protein [Herbaspirillum sp.]MCP4030975.1 hypothetical protein [Herbaspirillum sp.]